jgi:hypothetical protein
MLNEEGETDNEADLQSEYFVELQQMNDTCCNILNTAGYDDEQL